MLPAAYYTYQKAYENDVQPSFPRWVYFDMDGTIASLYTVPNWLAMLKAEDVTPYLAAEPIGEVEQLKALFNNLKRHGYHLGIVSWGAKGCSNGYTRAVKRAKVAWLNRYYPDTFEEIHVVKHGTPKHIVAKNPGGYLVDDEQQNRIKWGHKSIDASDYQTMITSLAALVKMVARNRSEVFSA